MDHVLADIISSLLKLDEKITKQQLNRAISNYYKNKIDMQTLHVINSHGVYKLRNEKRCNGI